MGAGEFAVTLDSVGYDAKPEGREIGGITERLKRAGGTAIHYERFTAAIARGQTWTPGTFATGATNDKGKTIWGEFQQLQIMALDFDNDAPVLDGDGKPVKAQKRPLLLGEPGYLSPTQALDRCESLGLMPFLMYFSFSACQGWPRYRLVFDLGEPVTNEATARAIIGSMLAEFPEADKQRKNPNRLYFGGKRKVHTFREVWPNG